MLLPQVADPAVGGIDLQNGVSCFREVLHVGMLLVGMFADGELQSGESRFWVIIG
jgi:hypothetical protein